MTEASMKSIVTLTGDKIIYTVYYGSLCNKKQPAIALHGFLYYTTVIATW